MASSFRLNSADTNPQDIVTDGTSFWVVDGSRLKVFKYTLSGRSLGSWSIDPADAHPTGITINPNNVSDLWIVDNGTDKVYQYVGAAGRTSGSQNAAATFALAAGDTNPQGIADPPPADLLLPPAPAPLAPNLPSSVLVNAAFSSGPAGLSPHGTIPAPRVPAKRTPSSEALPALSAADIALWFQQAASSTGEDTWAGPFGGRRGNHHA